MYVDTRTQTWPRSPGSNVATHTQSCCFPGVAALQSLEVSQLWCMWCRGLRPGPVHCRWLYKCLCIACGCQRSTARAFLWFALLRGPTLGPHSWGCGPACFSPSLTAYPACETSILAPNARNLWMKDATCRSSTRPLQKAKRIYHGPQIGPQIRKLGY